MADHPDLAIRLCGTHASIELVGGKAAALDELIALGAPVPDAGVLTTHAYRAFTATPSLANDLRVLQQSPVPPPDDHERYRAQIDELFLAAPMPGEVARAIAELAGDLGRSSNVAIRSSATAEDQTAASFAGQYRSFLDVSPADIERAVRLTWASLWHAAPRAYRRYHRIDESGLAMAVIVMGMLDPDFAGVVFTRDPAQRHDAMRVELVRGLGEALVSGLSTPRAFVLAGSGDERSLAEVTPALADLPKIARRLERELGAPQDIEWAVEGARLWILQARPITTGGATGDADPADDGFDVRAPDTEELTTAGIAEMLPGVLPPRLWELDSWLVEESFRRLFTLLGGHVDGLAGPHDLLVRYRGRAALDLDRLRAAVTSIPGGSPEELEHQYFGSATPGEPSAHARNGVSNALRTMRARTATVLEAEITVQTIDRVLDGEPDLGRLPDGTVLALGARVRHLAARAMAAEVAIAAMAAASYRGVEALLSRHLDTTDGESATEITQRITGRRGSGRSAIATTLRGIADDVRRDESLAARVVKAEDPTALGPFEERYRAAVRRAGSMSVYAGPTWAEQPEQAWRTFCALVQRPQRVRLDEPARRAARADIEKRIHHDRRWRATRMLTAQLVDARRAFVRREADDASELLDRRERTKAALLMLGGLQRRIDLEIAKRLVACGALEDPADIALLSEAESASMLSGPGPSFATVDARRRRLATATLDGPLPSRFTGTPPPLHVPVAGTMFRGWGASGGRYEGIARIAESPSTARLRRGEILVARSTDASWAPLFLIAGAIVVEDGGPLSHAAIVARELGVPAVLNVPGVMDRLAREAGDVSLTVDGSSGEVAIHRPARHLADGIAPTRVPLRASEPSSEGFNVFVTGLIGASALFSMIVALTQSISSVPGRARVRRRAAPIADMASTAVLEGFEPAGCSGAGLRARRWYGVAGAFLLLVSIALAARSASAYWQADGATGGAAVAFAAALSSALALAASGAAASRAAFTWPRVPLIVRRLAPARETWWSTTRAVMRRWQGVTVMVSVAMVLLLAALVTVRFSGLQSLDERIYDTLDWEGGAERWAPDWMNVIGRPAVAIALACLMALLALRCRVLAASIPGAIVVGGLAVLALTWLTARERPSLGGHAGESNSFPSGHAAQLTLLFALFPLVVHVVTSQRWIRGIARLASTATLVVLLADTLRTGAHWPSDHLAGVLLALSIVVVVHARFAAPEVHQGCSHCPHAVQGDET